ncbi:unnamed protein product [Cuscuta campestris]|uniref:Uncharacterized protein n=1 Tax=Cuscuta campestris TaxID=132261 RepID=A0A484KRK9_9ASTE|nr:unnamed protein product [Cuscuta campestris]
MRNRPINPAWRLICRRYQLGAAAGCGDGDGRRRQWRNGNSTAISSDWRRCNSSARKDAGSGGDVRRSAWRRCNSSAMRAAATGEGSSGGEWLGKGDRRRCNSTAADDRRRKQRRRLDSTAMMVVAGLPIHGDDIATYGGGDWILNNEAVVIRELGITNLIRHSGTPTIHSAPPDKRLLLYIITRILRPRDSSHTSLFNEELKAIHAIIHGASINWAKFVMIHMADCASIATERSLPYAFLVMDLIISADISIAGPDTKMTKIWIIQDSTFRKKSGDRDGTGPSRAPAPAPAKASLQSIADTLNRLTLTRDGMGQLIERMDWTLQRQHHDMTAFFRGINYVPPPFYSTFLGQNYEGEDEEDNSYAPSSSPDEADFEDAVDGDPMDVEDDEDADA